MSIEWFRLFIFILIMKRILFSLIFSVSTLTSFAGNGKIVVTEGNKSILFDKVSAQLIIDYSGAMWEGKSYKSFCGDDYQERIENSYDRFLAEFNKFSNGLLLTRDTDAKYNMTIKVQRFLRKVRSFYRGEVMIWCTIQISDAATGENLLTIDVSKSGGDSDYSYSEGIYKCFAELAKRINR